jgi:tRNA 2-thiouridine synthesizing protein A
MEARGESERTTDLLAELAALRDRPCVRCGRAVCGHEAVMSVALGFKNGARCLACLAAALGEEGPALRDHVMEHIRRRGCLSRGWLAASEHEGFGSAMHPACLWGDGGLDAVPVAAAPEATVHTDAPAVDAEWDAGELGCGDLVLALRLRLRAMAPGSILKLTARDPGAPEDLPAWCAMTGHALLVARHPGYWIKRREENRHDG